MATVNMMNSAPKPPSYAGHRIAGLPGDFVPGAQLSPNGHREGYWDPRDVLSPLTQAERACWR